MSWGGRVVGGEVLTLAAEGEMGNTSQKWNTCSVVVVLCHFHSTSPFLYDASTPFSLPSPPRPRLFSPPSPATSPSLHSPATPPQHLSFIVMCGVYGTFTSRRGSIAGPRSAHTRQGLETRRFYNTTAGSLCASYASYLTLPYPPSCLPIPYPIIPALLLSLSSLLLFHPHFLPIFY